MKRRAFLLLLSLAGCPAPIVQKPPPPPPPPPTAPADPAPVTEGAVTVAYENGLRIVVKQIPGAELCAMQLYLKGGVRDRDDKNAGLELMALRAAVDGGTKTLDKQVFARKLSALGSELGASSMNGYSVIGAKSLREEIDTTFAMMVDAFLEPALTANEIELQRERQLAGIKQREVTPDGRLELLVNQAVYTGHPYQNLPDGNLESVASFKQEHLQARLDELRQTSRLVLVVVGDVSVDHVRELARGRLAKLPRGSYRQSPLPKPRFEKPKLTVTKDALPTNYIEGSFMGPQWGDPDFPASILAMRVLTRRIWEEVRTKRNLSYAPSARYGWSGELTRGSVYVTAVDANTTMRVMLDEVKKLQETPIGATELAGAKSVFFTKHLMGNASTDGQASWLAICDLIGGDFRLSTELPERVKKVTAAEIQAFAKQHIRGLQTVVLGPEPALDTALFESL